MKIEHVFQTQCDSERLARIREIHRRSLAELRRRQGECTLAQCGS